MTVKRIVTPNKFIGVSTDTKPTQATNPRVRDGDTFLEWDTGNLYITYDGTNWTIRAADAVYIGDIKFGESLPAGTNRIGTVSGVLKEVRVAQVIDASLGAYTAGDVVSADDCCTTLAITWNFDVARAAGGYVYIVGATLINETPNQAVQYDLFLFNATPTGELRDNAANTNPLPADRSKYLGKIAFPYSVAKGATVATYTQANPGDGISGLPLAVKCGAAVTTIYGVLVTNTAYQQTATDDIEITLIIEQY